MSHSLTSESLNHALQFGLCNDGRFAYFLGAKRLVVVETEKLTRKIERPVNDHLSCIALTGDSNIIALVGSKHAPLITDKTLVLVDQKQQKQLYGATFMSAIKAIRMHPSMRLVVVMDNHISLRNLENMVEVACFETFPNPKGVVAITEGSGPMLVAYAMPANDGKFTGVFVQNLDQTESTVMINIQSPSAPTCMSLSTDGSMLALDTEHGSIINVYNASTGELKFAFGRGMSPAVINTIAFSCYNNILGVNSESGTLHLYSLRSEDGPAAPAQEVPTAALAPAPAAAAELAQDAPAPEQEVPVQQAEPAAAAPAVAAPAQAQVKLNHYKPGYMSLAIAKLAGSTYWSTENAAARLHGLAPKTVFSFSPHDESVLYTINAEGNFSRVRIPESGYELKVLSTDKVFNPE